MTLTPDAAFGAVLLFGLLAGGCAAFLRGNGQLALVLLWVPVALLPASNLIIPIGALLAERALYLPSAAVAFALVAGPWYVTARLEDRPASGQLAGSAPASAVDYREFGSYVWEYYLPRLPFQTRYGALGRYPQAYETWFKQAVGAFGWLETRWPGKVYAVLFVIAAAIAVAALWALVRRRRELDPMLLVFFATALITLVAGLHWNEYRLSEGSGTLASQGRYLFPLLSLAGLVVATALTTVPARLRGGALGALVGGLGALQLFAVALVVTRFYA